MLFQHCPFLPVPSSCTATATCSPRGPGAKPEGSAAGAPHSAWWDLCRGSEGHLCVLWAEAPASSFCVSPFCLNMGLHEFSCNPHWCCHASMPDFIWRCWIDLNIAQPRHSSWGAAQPLTCVGLRGAAVPFWMRSHAARLVSYCTAVGGGNCPSVPANGPDWAAFASIAL